MQVKDIKKNILSRMIVLLPILFLIVSALVYLNISHKKTIEKEKLLRSDINSLESKLNKLISNKKRLSEDMAIWRDMTEEEKKLGGLRINDAKDKVDKLSKKFYLSDVRTTFSKPEKLGDEFITETVGVLSSNIKISFKGITDEYVIRFVESLTKEFPGFIQLESFSVTAEGDVDKSTISQIAYGQDAQLVKGTVSFVWKDMKYTKPTNQKLKSTNGITG